MKSTSTTEDATESDTERRNALRDVAPEDVDRSLRQGVLWAIGTQLVTQLLRVLGVIVLARLLTKQDYGTASLAVTVASYSFILGDAGFGTALVQAKTASQRWSSTACWSAISAATVGFVVIALLAYPMGRILGEPLVALLLVTSASTLVFVAFGSTNHALLRRSMNFPTVQRIGVAALALATATGVLAASLGAGPWSLVAQQVVLAASASLLVIVAGGWRPSLEFSGEAFRSLSRFALPFTTVPVLILLQGLLTALLVGALVGVEALGVWSLSLSTVIIPMSLLATPLAGVIYAAFARMRDRPERVAEVWLNGMALLAAIMLPTLVGLVGLAPDLVPVVLGERWVTAVPVVQILAFLVMLSSLQTWNSSVLDAAGKPYLPMLVTAAVTVAIVPSVWLGSRYGLNGVAVGYVVAVLLCSELPSLTLTLRELSLSVWDVARRLRGVVLASGVMLCVVIVLRSAFEQNDVGVAVRLPATAFAGALVYVVLLMVFARSLALQAIRIARRR